MQRHTKKEVTLNESDAEMPVRGASKYPVVVLPSNKQPVVVAAVVNPSNFYVQLADQKADLAELMTSLVTTYNSLDSNKLMLIDTK